MKASSLARVGVLVLASCSDQGPKPSGIAAVAALVGEPLTGAVATAITVTVKVTDAKAVPVSNQIVNFVVTKGGGSVFAGTALTNGVGEAKEVWTLGTVAGEQSMEARAVDQTSGQPIVLGAIAATALPGPAVNIAAVTRVRSVVLVGVPTPLNVSLGLNLATDAYGNSIPLVNLMYSFPSGTAISNQTLTASEAGRYPIGIKADGFAQSVTVNAVDDVAKDSWTMTWRCVGLPPTDSLIGTATTTKVEYLTPPNTAENALSVRFTFTAERKQWSSGNPVPTLNTLVESFDGSLMPDSLNFSSLFSFMVRTSPARYATSDRGRCKAYSSGSPTILVKNP